MASTPLPNLLLNYLTELRDTAAQEIEARKPVELQSQDTPEVVPPLLDVTISHFPTMSGSTPEPPYDTTSPRLFASLTEAFIHHFGRAYRIHSSQIPRLLRRPRTTANIGRQIG